MGSSRPLSPDTLSAPVRARMLYGVAYSPQKITALLQVLVAQGCDPEAALAGTGLSVAQVQNPATRTSIQQWLNAARNALRLCDAPDLGLQVGLRMRASSYGMYGYLLLCAETVRHAFDLARRYQGLAATVMDIAWHEDGEHAVWVLPTWERVRLVLPEEPLFRFMRDMQYAIHVTLAKDVMGDWCVPTRIHLSDLAPDHAALISHRLGCPVHGTQGRNELLYPVAWLDRTPTLSNPITAAQLSGTCAGLLNELRWHGGITQRVYDELTRTPGRFPEIEAVASELCMTSRTLRRKLEAEGTSYSELLSRIRHALAIDYLGTTMLTIEDIAAALGFSDAASFRQAFKRWTGRTPHEYRH